MVLDLAVNIDQQTVSDVAVLTLAAISGRRPGKRRKRNRRK